ncbi:hypothetical protein ABPG75_006106 [Micractinium tetrahymenae]
MSSAPLFCAAQPCSSLSSTGLSRHPLHYRSLLHAGGTWVCSASRKGRKAGSSGGGRKGNGDNGGSSGSDAHRLQDTIRDSREQQLSASKMLAKLLEAADPAAVAAEHVASLNEEFFWTVDTYIKMAKKEGEAEVVARLEAAMRAAFEAKQATLRPEIRLLNRLLSAEGPEQRAQILAAPEAGQQLLMSDRYFFSLLGRMLGDVARQPEGEQRAQLLARLEAVKADAAAAAEKAEAAA